MPTISYGLELQRKFSLHDYSFIFDSKFCPEKENVAMVATIEGDILLLDLNVTDGSQISLRLERHHKGRPVRKLDFLNANNLVTAAKTIKIYDLNSGQFTRQLPNEGTKIYSLCCLEQQIICMGDDRGAFKLFDLRTGDQPLMKEKVCQDYISDLDTDGAHRMVLATSGDGSLVAFNIRNKKLFMQSEMFDAGFQCVRFLNRRGKAVVGAEDGALNIFNVGEYGNISDRFPLHASRRRQGECSIDRIEVVNDSLLVAGCSDGSLRLVKIFPNRVLHNYAQFENSVDSLAWNADSEQVLSSETNVVYIHRVVQVEVNEDDEMQVVEDDEPDDNEDSDENIDEDEQSNKRRKAQNRPSKKTITSTERAQFFSDL